MRIQILSDLHLEYEPLDSPEAPSADVVVLAGDIARGEAGLDWALSALSKPAIYVPGNHEFYECVRSEHIRRLRQRARNTHVTVLDRDSFTIEGVEFFGATLWTDFELYETPELDMAYAQRNVLDFHIIEESTDTLFSPQEAAHQCRQGVAWLEKALSQSQAAAKVVVTHHAPSRRSIVSRFAGSPLNPAFASPLEHLFQRHAIDLWVHGHMHSALDYELHGTRVVCNPRGYQPYESDNGFDPHLIVEINPASTDRSI
jgi:predicted phosphodiesterase